MYPYITIVLPSYTVFALLGAFVTLCFLYFRLDKYNIQFTSFLFMFLMCGVGGVVGSKLLFVITQIPWLINNFSVSNLIWIFPQSGFVFYGGLFGVIFMLYAITKNQLELRKRVVRLAVPAMPLFHAFGRIGCFMSGCCYGKNLDTPITIGVIQFTKIPVQLIESFAEFILFCVILVIDKKKQDINLLRIYLVSYSIVRFCDEFLRGDEVRGIYGGISLAQWISLSIIVFYATQYLKKCYQKTVKIP